MSSLISNISDFLLSMVGGCLPLTEHVLKLNGRDFRIVQELGEGGFSKVYLVREVTTHQLYTIKKVFLIQGEEEMAQMTFKEIDLLRTFQNQNIIKVLDVQVQQLGDGSRTIYIFLPYFRRGSLQDLITNIQNKTHSPLSEEHILKLFYDICTAVSFLHSYQLPRVEVNHSPTHTPNNNLSNNINEETILLDDEEPQDTNTTTNNNDNEAITPYAHRDLKPANILLDDDNNPILIDFGSCEKAKIHVKNHHQALQEQEKAEKYSTILFRAPELFDVQPNALLDEKVDIWSLGCVLYSMAYLKSPFEFGATEHGGSIALSVMNGKFYIPSNSSYSKEFNKLIKSILITDPNQRPDINEVLQLVKNCMNNSVE